MAALALGSNQSTETELRFDEVFFSRGKLEEFADGADLPTGALESFSLEQGTPDRISRFPHPRRVCRVRHTGKRVLSGDRLATPLTQERSGNGPV